MLIHILIHIMMAIMFGTGLFTVMMNLLRSVWLQLMDGIINHIFMILMEIIALLILINQDI